MLWGQPMSKLEYEINLDVENLDVHHLDFHRLETLVHKLSNSRMSVNGEGEMCHNTHK